MSAVTVRLWPGEDERSCCSPAAVTRARESAHALGLPHYSLAEEAAFARGVVDPFVADYLRGDTPNPCVTCNPLRLGRMVELANRLELGYVATGHYARLEWRGGEPFVARARDRAKDQSYMLWQLPTAVLRRLLLPVGELTKKEVRGRAARAGLPVASEPESQDVCFAPGDYRELLAARGARPRPGAIVSREGRVLGRHEGHWRYTIGQRRGLNVGSDGPLYVLERRAATNEIVVGSRAQLETTAVWLRSVVDRGIGEGDGLSVQLRYRAGAVGVAGLERVGADRARLTLTESFAGVAPGQSAVFYRGDVVVGGGVVAVSPSAGEASLHPRGGVIPLGDAVDRLSKA